MAYRKTISTMYRWTNGRAVKVRAFKPETTFYTVELESDGESDYRHYYKGNKLYYTERIDYIIEEA